MRTDAIASGWLCGRDVASTSARPELVAARILLSFPRCHFRYQRPRGERWRESASLGPAVVSPWPRRTNTTSAVLAGEPASQPTLDLALALALEPGLGRPTLCCWLSAEPCLVSDGNAPGPGTKSWSWHTRGQDLNPRIYLPGSGLLLPARGRRPSGLGMSNVSALCNAIGSAPAPGGLLDESWHIAAGGCGPNLASLCVRKPQHKQV